jgi:hypothetical protein
MTAADLDRTVPAQSEAMVAMDGALAAGWPASSSWPTTALEPCCSWAMTQL